MKILESYSAIAKSLLLEDDDDRYVHVGYGKYKEKDSRTGEPLPNSPVYIKTDAGKYIMPDDDEKGGEEEPKGGGMGSGDFERDFDDDETDYGDTRNAQHFSDEPEDDEPDTGDIPSAGYDDDRDAGRQADFDREYGDKERGAQKQTVDAAEKIADKYGIESDISGNEQGTSHVNIGVGGEYEGDNQIMVSANDFGSGSSTGGANKGIQYQIGINGDDAMNGPIIGKMYDSKEEMESVLDKVLGNKKIKNALNKGDSLEGMKDEIESLMRGKDETVTINGKQYRPIKESKQHILKENYERFFGDKK